MHSPTVYAIVWDSLGLMRDMKEGPLKSTRSMTFPPLRRP